MKKIKISPSVVLLLVVCACLGRLSLLFGYLLALFLHEMAHLVVAFRRGYSLKFFKFDLFGMSVELTEEVDDLDSFSVNVAGPLFNLFLVVVCLALYWCVPAAFGYLNEFCLSNLVLAVFNLLPIYPLDGGKIFRGIIKNDKVYIALDRALRVGFFLVFFSLFVASIWVKTNYFYLVFAVFFLLGKPQSRPNFSLFKKKRHKTPTLDKVTIFHVTPDCTLLQLLKSVRKSNHTMFYCEWSGTFLDERRLIELATTQSLDTRIGDI